MNTFVVSKPGGSGTVSDTAYDATSWDNATDEAPSKNAVRDKFETLGTMSVQAANAVNIDGGTIDGTTIATSNITVGAGKTLDVSAGTLTLADSQIAGAKIAQDLADLKTNTAQPAFLVKPITAQENFAVGSWVDVDFANEIVDQTNNFASSLFTTPVAGKYCLSCSITFINIDSSATLYLYRILTTGTDYTQYFDPSQFAGDVAYFSTQIVVPVANLGAADTAKVQVYQTGGTQQTDISVDSYFSGFLIC